MRSDTAERSIVLPLVLLAALVGVAATLWFAGPLVTIGGLAPFEAAATRALFILSFSVPMLILIYVIWRQRRPRTTGKPRRSYWRYAIIALIAALCVAAAITLWDGGSSGFDAGHVLIAFGLLAIAWAATWYYERNGTRRAAIIYAALVAVSAVIAANVVISYRANLALIETAQNDIDAYQTAAAAVPRGPVGDTDFLVIRPALKTLRNMPGTGVFGQTRPSLASTWGLNQSGSIGGQTARTYRSALNQMLLPRMLVRLEDELQVSMNDPDRLFAALKVYLMLGLQGPMDRDEVFQWMRDDWLRLYGRGDSVVDELLDHLDALTSQPMEAVALNGPLVEQARIVLVNVPRAQRLYRAILNRPEMRELPPFQLTEIDAPTAARTFVRISGKPLDEGIDGAFSRDGFHLAFLPELTRTVAFQKQDGWVLGDALEEQLNDGGEAVLTQNILELYYADYVDQYESLLNDIEIRPVENLDQADDLLSSLLPGASQIEALLQAVATETRFADYEIQDNPALTTSAKSLLGRRSILSFNVLRRANPEALPDDLGQPVQDRFAWLHDLTRSENGQPSALADAMVRMSDLSGTLQLSIAREDIQMRDAAMDELAQLGTSLIDPLGRWTSQVASGASSAVASETRGRLNAEWTRQVLPICENSTRGRYPFVKQSTRDVALGDFARVFGPDGAIDLFFEQNLSRYADRTQVPWRWNSEGEALGLSNAALAQFERARGIRDIMFPDGSAPSVQFSLRPTGLDPRILRVTLQIHGNEFGYGHGPMIWGHFAWPGNDPSGARIAFKPEISGIENAIVGAGVWGWFRLLEKAEIRPAGNSDQFNVNFRLGVREATFEMRENGLGAVPIAAMHEFKCPSSL